ncbi:YlmH protein [Streptococcus pneumoniae]|nr:YlmH protein [Streptococcus pneumoniae]
MNKGIYQHFSIEDRPFLDKGMEWIKKVEDSYAPFLTPFINPHQEKLLKILAKTYGLACSSSGEFVSSEYVRVLLYPDYFQPEFSDFEYLSRKLCIPINLNI